MKFSPYFVVRSHKKLFTTKAIWWFFSLSHLFFAPISTGASPLSSKMNLELKIARFRFFFLLGMKRDSEYKVAAADWDHGGIHAELDASDIAQECRVNEIKKIQNKTNRDVVFGWVEFHSINEITDVNFQR